jgi:hypothetical protein
MTHSVDAPPRKPSRLGLYLPWAVALLLAVGWSAWWVVLRLETEHRIDAAAAAFRTGGGQVTWQARHIGGYPFRLDVDVTGLNLAGSGWALALPSLKSEAYAFAPTRWIFATEDGATLTPPGGTPIRIASPLMRASLNSWDEHPPRLSFVGDDLAFNAGPTFPLASARSVQVYTRAGPNDQGAFLFKIDGGTPASGSRLSTLAAGQPVSLSVDAVFSRASALQAGPWRASVLGWSAAGGAITVQHVDFAAGPATLAAHAGAFGVGPDGALTGQAPAGLTLTGKTSLTALSAHDGALWLGVARLGPAPRAF